MQTTTPKPPPLATRDSNEQAWQELLEARDTHKWNAWELDFLEDLSTMKWSALTPNQKERAREMMRKID